jgi:hypothetical protein
MLGRTVREVVPGEIGTFADARLRVGVRTRGGGNVVRCRLARHLA